MTTLPSIRERAAKATKGPWHVYVPSVAHVRVGVDADEQTIICWGGIDDADDGGVHGPTVDEARANAAFIAHARTDIPFLLAEVDRLTAQVEAMRTLALSGAKVSRDA